MAIFHCYVSSPEGRSILPFMDDDVDICFDGINIADGIGMMMG